MKENRDAQKQERRRRKGKRLGRKTTTIGSEMIEVREERGEDNNKRETTAMRGQ